MLTALILLIEAISPIDAALPHIRALPDARPRDPAAAPGRAAHAAPRQRADLSLRGEISAQLELGKRMHDEGARPPLRRAAEALAEARYSTLEDKAWAAKWAEDGREYAPAEEEAARAEERLDAIAEALETLANHAVDKDPRGAAYIAGLMRGVPGPARQRGVVSALLKHHHLEPAAGLAKNIEDFTPEDRGCEGEACEDAIEPELEGTEARLEVLHAALDAGDWGVTWATLKALKDPGGEGFQDLYYEALTATLPHAIRRSRLPELLKLERARSHANQDAWPRDVIRALLKEGQIDPAIEMIRGLKDHETRAALVVELTLKMKQLGRRLEPSRLKALLEHQ